MRYRYTIKTRNNRKYIQDEDTVDYDTPLSVKATVYDKIDADLVNELNRLNDIAERQAVEINRLKQENSFLRRDAQISKSIKTLKQYINQNI